MGNVLSFMGANFVARECGYLPRYGGDWAGYETVVQAAFRPLATFRPRFAALLDEIAGLGFDALDLWSAHLHYEWATIEHIAIAIEELKSRKLLVTSYAGSFGAEAASLRACCRLADALGVRVLGGVSPLLASDRAALLDTLREFGMVLALENHPEKSPAELLARLGSPEPHLRVAVDTGWFAAQGYPAPAALAELLPHAAIVHLKDVRAEGAHDCCPYGEGIVDIDQCLHVLREHNYTGPISIEYEPFDKDPRSDCRTMLDGVRVVVDPRRWRPTAPRRVRTAIVGCGNISDAYGRQLAMYPEIALHAVTDTDPSRARAFEQKFGSRAYPSLDGLLADADVELVINLTIHSAHHEVIAACLDAGKHVYTEKPLATEARQAWELVRMASDRDLRLGSAPSTWLGEAQQTAWRLIRAGALGTPRVAYAEVNWGRIEDWHPNPAPFYAVGPVFDVAVYPLTLLTAWFGPIRTVEAGGGIVFPKRRTPAGEPFVVESEDWTCAVLKHEGGVYSRITSSFYVGGPDAPRGLEVYGDLGSLSLSRWDEFDARLGFGEVGKPRHGILPDRLPARGIEYARGVQDMAQAMLENRHHRCTGEQAAHVVDVCAAILTSAREGRRIGVTTGFPKPAAVV